MCPDLQSLRVAPSLSDAVAPAASPQSHEKPRPWEHTAEAPRTLSLGSKSPRKHAQVKSLFFIQFLIVLLTNPRLPRPRSNKGNYGQCSLHHESAPSRRAFLCFRKFNWSKTAAQGITAAALRGSGRRRPSQLKSEPGLREALLGRKLQRESLRSEAPCAGGSDAGARSHRPGSAGGRAAGGGH